jgi:hypothetical protein
VSSDDVEKCGPEVRGREEEMMSKRREDGKRREPVDEFETRGSRNWRIELTV